MHSYNTQAKHRLSSSGGSLAPMCCLDEYTGYSSHTHMREVGRKCFSQYSLGV